MENGSKAIIIAGTIIVVMLFVAVGMYFFVKAGHSSGNVKNKYTQDEINAFNDQFAGYEFEQKGSRVKELIVRVNNSNEKFDNRVEITKNSNSSDVSDFVTYSDDIYYPKYNLKNSDTYRVTFVYNDNHVIEKIVIVK